MLTDIATLALLVTYGWLGLYPFDDVQGQMRGWFRLREMREAMRVFGRKS